MKPEANHPRALTAGALCLLAGAGLLRSGTIEIPNGSFESPVVPYVDTNVDSWQKTPKPDWYQETGGFFWSQLTGTFKNPAPGAFDHISNCHGSQAVWLFAVPEVGLFQDYDSVDWNDPEPTHAFDATFEVGKAYVLTAGIIGAGGGMSNGVTMEIGLYYRDHASNQVTVASQVVTNSPGLFGDRTQLIDFEARLPTVRAGDPWAGQHIGVRLFSTVGFELQGGYWDVDHVRLTSRVEPALVDPMWKEGRLTFQLLSEPGLRFAVLGSADITLPPSSWTVLATLTNVTGLTEFTDPSPNEQHGFFQARQLP